MDSVSYPPSLPPLFEITMMNITSSNMLRVSKLTVVLSYRSIFPKESAVKSIYQQSIVATPVCLSARRGKDEGN